MTDNKKAVPVGKLDTASRSNQADHSNPMHDRLKAGIYRLAPWLSLLGVLHG